MPVVSCLRFQARPHECDSLGLLSSLSYARWMEETAMHASAEVGWTTERYQAEGYLWVIRQTSIDFLHPIRLAESIEVKTWVMDMRRVRSHRQYEFRNQAGVLVAKAITDWVFWDTRKQRLASIPQEVMRAYAPELTAPDEP